jgi:GT2 family glycosyltransferase
LDTKATSSHASVGVIVVNWNGWRNTLQGYESLVACDYPNWVFLIVDNASTDDSVPNIRKHMPRALLVESRRNLGFAGGCNLAISTAMSMGLEYVLLLNSDATVTADCLHHLVSASAGLGDRAVLGSVVRFWPSGQLQYFGSQRSKEKSGGSRWYTEAADGEMLKDELVPTDFVFGAALFAATELFRIVGMFDERFFLNYEETDWCYRAAAQGIPSFVVVKSTILHQGSASLGSRLAPLQTYFMSRNKLLFLDKHGSIEHRISAYKEVARELISRLSRRDRGLQIRGYTTASTRAFLLAVRDYILRRFGDCPSRVRTLARENAKTT